MTDRKITPDILGDPAQAQPVAKPLGAEYVSLADIQTDGGTQMRANLNDDTVQEYVAAFTSSEDWPFPPVITFHDGETHWLADGFHRVAAARIYAERHHIDKAIPAQVSAGTRRDAILYAAGANARHGLRRTDKDKRRAVETLLRDPEWSQWSKREIARRCNVSDFLVADVLKDMDPVLTAINCSEEVHYTTKHGTAATMQTANIGAKPPAPSSVDSRPWAEMYQLEQAVRRWLDTCEVIKYDSRQDKVNQCRILAAQHTGMLWEDLLTHLPAPRRKNDVIQALFNVGEQMRARGDSSTNSATNDSATISPIADAPAAKLPHRENLPPAAATNDPEPGESVAMVRAAMLQELPANPPAAHQLVWLESHYPAWFQSKFFWRWMVAEKARNTLLNELCQEVANALATTPNGWTPVEAPPSVTMDDAVRGIAQRSSPEAIVEDYLRSLLAQSGLRRLSVIIDSAQGFSVDAWNPGRPMTTAHATLQAAVAAMTIIDTQPQPVPAPATTLPRWQANWDEDDEQEWQTVSGMRSWTIDDLHRRNVVARMIEVKNNPELTRSLLRRYSQLNQSTDQPIPTF